MNVFYSLFYFMAFRYATFVSSLLGSGSTCIHFLPLDVDECATKDTNECDSNAGCSNTEGSYVCRCLKGFQGDGRNCTGMYWHTLNSLDLHYCD